MRELNFSNRAITIVKCVVVIFLIPVYFVLEANNQYWGLIPTDSSIKIGVVVLMSIIASFLLLNFFIKKNKSLMIVWWFSIHYLYFWIIYKAVISIHFISFLSHYKYYLPFLLICTVGYIFFILKSSEGRLMKMTSYLTLLLLLLVFFEFYKVLQNRNSDGGMVVACKDSIELKDVPLFEKPDVFLIVVDEYAGFKTLKDHYKFDNADFSKKLESKGFFVAKNPRSNYNGTLFSTMSLLNMSYLDTNTIGDFTSIKAYARTAKAIEGNLIFDFFRRNGYTVINNSFLRISGTPTRPFLVLPIEDRLVTNKTFGNILQSDLLINLPLNEVQCFLGTFYAKSDSYNQKAIANLKQGIKDSSKPLFLYTHLMMPHSPYLRDENGKLRGFAIAHAELKSKKYKDSYVQYLKYCNSVIGQIVDSILSERKNSIVLLVSDHGNRFINSVNREMNDFSNFIAVYNNNRNYSGFTDSVSLVNVFRLVLNNQFGQKISELPSYQTNVTKGVLN